MDLFTAGNFCTMAKVESEKRFIAEATKRYGSTFKRLVSYYFEDKTDNVFEARKQFLNEKEKVNGKAKLRRVKSSK